MSPRPHGPIAVAGNPHAPERRRWHIETVPAFHSLGSPHHDADRRNPPPTGTVARFTGNPNSFTSFTSRSLAGWYNREHHHSGIGLLTPEDVHFGRAANRIAARAEVLASAYVAHPERFVRGVPHPAAAPTAAWINAPKLTLDTLGDRIDLVGSPQSDDLVLGEGFGTPTLARQPRRSTSRHCGRYTRFRTWPSHFH